jgi:hypothetical protein
MERLPTLHRQDLINLTAGVDHIFLKITFTFTYKCVVAIKLSICYLHNVPGVSIIHYLRDGIANRLSNLL